jgi:hypothetical protein
MENVHTELSDKHYLQFFCGPDLSSLGNGQSSTYAVIKYGMFDASEKYLNYT